MKCSLFQNNFYFSTRLSQSTNKNNHISMRQILIPALILMTSSLAFSQEKTATYNHGHNGMEYVVSDKKGTTIVSTFNSKMNIKDEVAIKVFSFYKENTNAAYDTITIQSDKAKVTGKIEVKKRGQLTAVNFFYEKVEWENGLVEVYAGNNKI